MQHLRPQQPLPAQVCHSPTGHSPSAVPVLRLSGSKPASGQRLPPAGIRSKALPGSDPELGEAFALLLGAGGTLGAPSPAVASCRATMKSELIHHISRAVNPSHLNGAQPPEKSPESVGRADVDGVSFTAALGKVWGPLHGVA